jgi:5-methylcytosine-specific restriction endonuclease McrA
MKLIEQFVRSRGHAASLAYYDPNWRRDAAPLLDELGASVDHVEAHARGGPSEIGNLATICGKCNVRKGTLTPQEHLSRHPVKKVKGKYGEPAHWDGLASLLVLLVEENPKVATASERAWARALTAAWTT